MAEPACECASAKDNGVDCDCAMQGACICDGDCKCKDDVCKNAEH